MSTNERDEHQPISATYGHGSITLTAYPSSGRVRVEASADNSVMDWSELFEFVDRMRRPRIITTVEGLDALPFETVIRDADRHVLERWGEMYENGWVTPMVTSFVPHDQIRLPATVLYDPSAS